MSAQMDIPVWVNMLTGGVSACFAEFCTLPLDTAKVRLQVQKKGGEDAYKGVLDCLKRMAAEEGLPSLWSGLAAGFQRQLVFASLRLGLYEPIRNLISGGQAESGLGVKILAGLSTGTIGMLVANPTDLVKVRLQAQGIAMRKDPNNIRYTGVLNAYSKILKQEGFLAFWTGVAPNILRNSVINAAELSTFDQTKQTIVKYNILPDNVFAHLVSSATAGFVATAVGSPVDVIKTRVMNAKAGESSIIQIVTSLIKKEGLGAFYNGFAANAQRMVSWNITMFLTWNQLKQFTAKKYHNH